MNRRNQFRCIGGNDYAGIDFFFYPVISMFHKDLQTRKAGLISDKNTAAFYFCLPSSTRKIHQQRSGTAFFLKASLKLGFLSTVPRGR